MTARKPDGFLRLVRDLTVGDPLAKQQERIDEAAKLEAEHTSQAAYHRTLATHFGDRRFAALGVFLDEHLTGYFLLGKAGDFFFFGQRDQIDLLHGFGLLLHSMRGTLRLANVVQQP